MTISDEVSIMRDGRHGRAPGPTVVADRSTRSSRRMVGRDLTDRYPGRAT